MAGLFRALWMGGRRGLGCYVLVGRSGCFRAGFEAGGVEEADCHLLIIPQTIFQCPGHSILHKWHREARRVRWVSESSLDAGGT